MYKYTEDDINFLLESYNSGYKFGVITTHHFREHKTTFNVEYFGTPSTRIKTTPAHSVTFVSDMFRTKSEVTKYINSLPIKNATKIKYLVNNPILVDIKKVLTELNLIQK